MVIVSNYRIELDPTNLSDHLPVHFHFAVDGNVIHNMGSYAKNQFMNIDGIKEI